MNKKLESELDWTNLDGATQTAVEKASDEIRLRKITDEEEIENIVRNWCNEIGYANEYELPEYSEGYMTEPDTDVAIKYVKQNLFKKRG